MTPEILFSICNVTAMFGWLLLIFAPRKKWATFTVAGMAIPLVLASMYAFLFLAHSSEATGGFSSLQGVASLFSNPWILLAGWIHYLTFDLFIGAWQVRDSVTANVPHALLVPCLILTFLLGPIGLGCYLALRFVRSRSLSQT